jgi:predicted SnoaL-like aldol condensation-catalyzing enzyme
MKTPIARTLGAGTAVVLIALSLMIAAHAGPPPTPAPDQEALLKSNDPQLEANKRLVYEVMRKVMIPGHVEYAEQYVAKDYIQHNPGITTGRDGFIAFMKSLNPIPKPIPDRVPWPLVTIMAEGDLVLVATVHKVPDARDPTKTVKTTWFDLYRIKDGKLAEHWDESAGEVAKPRK